jgi:glycine cleavage system transcriptional repressor
MRLFSKHKYFVEDNKLENLLITTICRNDKKVLNELARLTSKHECNIDYSHLATLGLDNSLTMRITGNWSSIAKIETALISLAKRMEIEIIFKRSHIERVERYFLPYKIEIIALDQIGIVSEIIDFLSSLEVNMQYLQAISLTHQQTPILRMEIEADIPADNNIADVREQFLLFCDELNLDGTLEPQK